MLENLPESELTVIDTFAGGEDLPNEVDLLGRFNENTAPYKDRIKVLQGTSREKLKSLSDSFDFIYIDGSHLASSVLEDAVLAFPLLKSDGGIMIFDDYTWGRGMGMYDIPLTGIDAFLIVYGNQLKVLEKNSQVVITKEK
jgi:predicted O-methyltransferase YrrM